MYKVSLAIVPVFARVIVVAVVEVVLLSAAATGLIKLDTEVPPRPPVASVVGVG